jgi:hypothetical protein
VRSRRSILVVGCALAIGASSRHARALDVGKVAGEKMQLDVTDTTVVSQRFNEREGEDFRDQGWGQWINRLNAALRWDKWTAGLRLDSALYWERPIDRAATHDPPPDASELKNVLTDNETRFRNRLYPAKAWITYAAPGIEVTAGDAYVQFGRGLTLSMRKLDDLGLDNTVRGAKVQIQKDPVGLILVAGFANPSRTDEATGRSLFPSLYTPAQPLLFSADPTQPVFGSDRIVGFDVQAGRGLPVVLSTHGVRFTRCAPFAYDANGNIDDRVDGLGSPIGSCDSQDVDRFFSGTFIAGPTPTATEIDMAGQSIEVPSLGGHGKLYVEGAVQHRKHDVNPQTDPYPDGNALYAQLSFDVGVVSNTLELKSYHNFYPVSGSVSARAADFNTVVYSAPPTAEIITQDSALGFFNACVDGGRLRSDVRLGEGFFFYGQGIVAYTRSEVDGGGCDQGGHTRSGSLAAAQVQTNVWDGLAGFEWQFDHDLSHLFLSSGARDDNKATGDFYYREIHAEYSLSKYISGPYSVEVTGRARYRKEADKNIRDGYEQWWREGENYVALKVAPKWVFTQGFEYKSIVGEPTYYFNGSVLYKFRSDSNLRVFVGQQRGGLRCVSGICKVFPAFEGARAELTLRF